MFSYLKKHPFGVQAFFEHSIVLTYALPVKRLIGMLPPCLVPDTFEDKWAFVAVAMVQAKDLRPQGFPKFMGNDLFLIGYRIFVRYVTNAGKRLRGLYILGSTTNSRKMAMLGNIFTHYNYAFTDIAQDINSTQIGIVSKGADIDVRIDTGGKNVSLPTGTPFADWKQARRFAGPLPFTFSYDADSREVLIIEGVREFWEPRPIEILRLSQKV